MATIKQGKASAEFVRRLKKAMAGHPDKPSLREVARRADLSASYLSYLLNGERPAPSNDAIVQLERVLHLPQGELNKVAGRPDNQALEFFRKEEAAPIMRTLAEVPAGQLGRVQEMIERFVRRQRSKTK